MRVHGVPDQVLTDNGKVFTARFGRGPGPVLFDRICVDNGIRHLLTAPYSPTTTGKVERFHKTLRREWLAGNDYRHATLAEAQASLDRWVDEYNTERPHQSIGDRPPIERFRLAAGRDAVGFEAEPVVPAAMSVVRPPGVIRWVDQRGQISLARFSYKAGRVFAGEPVEVVCRDGLVEILYKGTVIATHAQRLRPGDPKPTYPHPRAGRPRAATSGPTVTRVADASGTVSFAGASYRAGRAWARSSVQVAVVGASVQLSIDGKVVRTHAIRHDRSKEHGAYATPNGRPRKPQTA
jgi:hypothetical protein